MIVHALLYHNKTDFKSRAIDSIFNSLTLNSVTDCLCM